MTYAKRVDLNHGEIRDGLRKAGYNVTDTHDLGHGFPDLCVIAGETIILLEVKRPGEKLTPDEVKFFAEAGYAPVYVVHSLEKAILRAREAAMK